MTPRSRPGHRRSSALARRPQILVFAEGRQTEPLYFTHWYRACRDRVIVKIARHQETTPVDLVRRAIRQRSADLVEARHGQGDAYDQYWCVFDVDEHPGLEQALALAAGHDIHVAVSSPCFELWLILHFEYRAGYLDSAAAERLAAAYLGCGKVLTPAALAKLADGYDVARQRARLLGRKHVADGSGAHANPSTAVWRLVDEIQGPPAADARSGPGG